MNRHYSIEEYEHSLALLRQVFHEPALTTDVIVGFAGETEEEFAVTVEALKRMNLYEMHIFKYSVRKGTRAEKMPNQVPEQKKTERSNVLLEMGQNHKETYEKQWIGQEEEILAEEFVTIDGETYLLGHTKRYVKLAVKTAEDYIGQLVKVRIIGQLNSELLIAEIID